MPHFFISPCWDWRVPTPARGISQRPSDPAAGIVLGIEERIATAAHNSSTGTEKHICRSKTQCFKIFHGSLSIIHKTHQNTSRHIKTHQNRMIYYGLLTLRTTKSPISTLETCCSCMFTIFDLIHKAKADCSQAFPKLTSLEAWRLADQLAGHGMKFPTFAFGGAHNDERGMRGDRIH